eukprot:12034334-Alexandrium_andersonii.AAC.1
MLWDQAALSADPGITPSRERERNGATHAHCGPPEGASPQPGRPPRAGRQTPEARGPRRPPA